MAETPTDAGRDPWEQPEQVERFAARDPDRRLVALLEAFPDPPRTRVLDLGCAAGRNTVLLAERGVDVHAIDRSAAMVRRTRQRVAAVLGAAAAEDRVRRGEMEDLSACPDGSFHLVVALGIYHVAPSVRIWDRAAAETHRVMAPGGLLLVSVFGPPSEPEGRPLDPAPGGPPLYLWPSGGVVCLFGAADLDARFRGHGFALEVPTETVRAPGDGGHRVTLNALFRKPAGRG